MEEIITSESVNIGHPDKTCDTIADAFLDEALRQDENSQMAVECAIKNNNLFIYGEATTTAKIDYENILDAGFKNVELIPIYEREYYKTNDDLLALLLKTPILNDFSEEHENNNLIENNIDKQILNQYIENNTTNKGILLRRRYYGIVASK